MPLAYGVFDSYNTGMDLANAPIGVRIMAFVLFLWTIFWKVVALWRSAKNNQRNWFIAIVILNLNTLGIVEIVYLFRFAKKRLTLNELKNWRHLLTEK